MVSKFKNVLKALDQLGFELIVLAKKRSTSETSSADQGPADSKALA